PRSTNDIADEYIVGDTCRASPRGMVSVETSARYHTGSLDIDGICRRAHLRSCLCLFVAVASVVVDLQRGANNKLVRRLAGRHAGAISQDRAPSIRLLYR